MLPNKQSCPDDTLVANHEGPSASHGWWLFVFYLCLFTITNAGFDASEGSLSYRQAVIMVTEGRLTVDGEPENINYFPGPDHHLYCARELGSAIVQLPMASINEALGRLMFGHFPKETITRGQNFLAAIQAGVFMALGIRYFFLILIECFRQSVRAAWIATLLLVLTTFCWSYSRSLFDGVLALPFLTGSLYHLLRFRSRASTRDLAIASILVGFGVAVRISLLFGVVGLFVFLIAITYRQPRVLLGRMAIATAALAPFGLWVLFYNYLRTGSPFVSPMQLYENQNGLNGNLAEGLLGLTLSPGKGLFVYCPLLLISCALFPRFARRDPATTIYLIVVCGLWFVIHARLKVWYGSWGWGPRHFVTIVPLLMLPFAVEIKCIAKSWLAIGITAILAAWGFILAFSSIVINFHHRMVVALQENRLDDNAFIWSIPTSQSIDAINGCIHNFRVILGLAQPDVVEKASAINVYASNTVNIWINTLTRFGLPPALTIIAFVSLIAIGAYAGLRSFYSIAQAPSPKN
jgi:hypothetical protein